MSINAFYLFVYTCERSVLFLDARINDPKDKTKENGQSMIALLSSCYFDAYSILKNNKIVFVKIQYMCT